MVEATTGEPLDAPVYQRHDMRPGTSVSGPAAIAEAGTTTIIPTGFTARIAHGGEIVIEGGAA